MRSKSKLASRTVAPRHAFGRLSRVWLLAGCLASPLALADTDHYEDALRRYDAQDIQGAIVQLKNALQQNPNLLPAQVLLADAYLQTGQSSAAEGALELAVKLGADRAVTAPRLAKAYLGQFKYRLLLDRVSPQDLPPAEAAEVLIARSTAYAGLGELKEAEKALGQAEARSPGSASVKVALGTLRLRQGDLNGARGYADKAVSQAPNNAAAWNLKASVAHLAGQGQAALEAYGKALALQPEYLDVLVARAGLLVDMKRQAEADKDIQVLAKHAASDPRAAYLVSLAAARRGDKEGVRKALTNAVTIVDQIPPELIKRNPQLLMLGGLAHYGLGTHEKASAYLSGYVAIQPRHAGARKLLASILLARRDHKEAIQLLSPLLDADPPDPQVLSMMGTAYLGRKQYAQASELFERASRLAPDMPAADVGLGLTRLGEGQMNEGIATLQSVVAKDANQIGAGMILAKTHLRRGEAAKAVEVLRKIVAKTPDNPAILNLYGESLLATRNEPEARKVFTQAAVKDRNYLPVQFNIARLDLAAGQQDAVRRRLNTVLKFNPDQPEALSILAWLESQSGRPTEAVRLLERVRAGSGKPLGPLLQLVALYQGQGNPQAALSVAQEMEAAYPDNLAVQEALGRAYLAVGSVDKARATFSQMSRNAGYDSQALTRVAQLLMGVRAFDAAGHALNKALSNNPGYAPARFLLAELDMAAGRLASAEKRAQELRNARTGDPAAAHLLGTIYMAQQKHAAAIQEFQAALGKDRNGANTLALFQAYLAAGQGPAALELMQAWLKDHPKDVAAEAALAEAHLRLGNLDQARKLYEAYVQKRPKDAGAFNNLANIALARNDPKALGYAQQAQSLAPESPAVADTLGWILVRQGQPQKALPYLRDARLRDASNPLIQYHLGAALHQMGRTAEARTELRGAVASKRNFEGKEEAQALLNKL